MVSPRLMKMMLVIVGCQPEQNLVAIQKAPLWRAGLLATDASTGAKATRGHGISVPDLGAGLEKEKTALPCTHRRSASSEGLGRVQFKFDRRSTRGVYSRRPDGRPNGKSRLGGDDFE